MLSGMFAPLKRWWESQRDRHLFILGTITFLSTAVVLWAIVYFFFLGGAQDPDLEHLIDWTWAGLIVGAIVLVFVAPEFLHYQGKWSLLMEVLKSTSRPDLGRQRKDAEEAATLLGSVWSARLKAHYVKHGLAKGKAVNLQSEGGVPEDLIINWWRTEDSRLSRMIDAEVFREPWLNRSLGSVGLIVSVLQLCNMSFGLARNAALERENTIIVWDWLSGSRIDSVPAPYFDDISGWVLLFISLFLLWVSFPASGERPTPSITEDEEE